MALLNSLFAGVSGLRNHQSMMDVIGNNIANVNTIGFKGSRITFSDTFNQFVKSGTNPTGTSGGTNSFQVGLGMKVNSIDRNWNQGTFERTGITTDLALQGPGMFILKSNGQQFYARAGAFIFDADGKLVNPQNGAIVQGKVANGLGEIPAGTALQDIVIDKNLRLPAVKTTQIDWGGNLQSSSTTIRTDSVELSGNLKKETPAATTYYPGTIAYDATDSSTYTSSVIYNKDGKEYELRTHYSETTAGAWTANYDIWDNSLATPASVGTGTQALAFDVNTGACTTTQMDVAIAGENLDFKLNFASLSNLVADTNVVSRIDKSETPEPVLGSVTVFDSLGNPHTMSIKYEHLDSNRWSWSATVPTTSGNLMGASGEIRFKTDGTIQSVWQGGNQVTSSPPVPQITFTPASGAEPQIIEMDFGSGTAGVTQTNLASQIAALSQNGSASSALANINIDQYGNILGIFSNGNSRNLAQIMVATFKNANGLVSVGDNMYNVAANSGDPRIDTPGENSVTTIQSGALEQSNVDLSEEFTRMIVSQRGFQANARVVTTADSLLQEITNLIR
ncbi:MAG: flagellar hook protein FlgE [Ignavibacteriae bacterium HGW-Ignavibacteriae-2]|jgi:flagellar hook protein FlgE|nr:flagellar hook protein FlgE [Bacteroidota bacterium]PKL89261.1 MAG: flagellar hook protein FlgE [Ignavibacteriae bacterium HGW-Ignavibacteriae-2]